MAAAPPALHLHPRPHAASRQAPPPWYQQDRRPQPRPRPAAFRLAALLHLRPRQQAAFRLAALLHLRPRQQAVCLALLHLRPRPQAVCLALPLVLVPHSTRLLRGRRPSLLLLSLSRAVCLAGALLHLRPRQQAVCLAALLHLRPRPQPAAGVEAEAAH